MLLSISTLQATSRMDRYEVVGFSSRRIDHAAIDGTARTSNAAVVILAWRDPHHHSRCIPCLQREAAPETRQVGPRVRGRFHTRVAVIWADRVWEAS